jgi:hypothetical protein
MDSFYFLITAVLTLVLVVTGFYYSIQSKKQLEKNLDETKAEVAMAARPLLVIRAVVHEAARTYEANIVSAPKGAQTSDDRPLTSHFSHFELFNAGNSPAIDLEILLMNAEKVVLQGETLGFLRNNEQALTFVPFKLELRKTYYLVCEYESIRSRVRKIWHQTWLPFMTIEGTTKGTINVNVGELEFKEASITECINAFKTKEKPH